MRKSLAVAAVAALALAGLALPTEAQDLRVRSNEAKSAATLQSTNADAINGVLRDLAQGMAKALAEPSMRQIVAEGVAQRFDGDTNVLYRDLANRRLESGATVRDALAGKLAGRATAASRTQALGRLDAAAMALPRLQVAVPVNFDRWQVEQEVPRVAFVPVGVDDEDLYEVEAFDAQGNRYLMDARNEPLEAVVVISLNERTDDNGFLRTRPVEVQTLAGPTSIQGAQVTQIIEDPDSGGGGGGGGGGTTSGTCTSRTHAYGDKEIFYQIKINNDHEPWTKGSPEIYATYAFADSTGAKGRYHMENVDDEGTWYTLNGHLFYWQSYWGNTFIMAIWEQDGSDLGTLSYSYGGLSYSVKIYDGDDQLGYNPISFSDPTCGYYSTGDAEYKLRHVAP